MQKALSRVTAVALIWNAIKFTWELIGHFGNVQSVWDIVNALTSNWPTIWRETALAISSWWLPLAFFVACLAAQLVLYRRSKKTPRVAVTPAPASLPSVKTFQLRCGTDTYSTNILTGNIPARYLHAEVSISSGTVHGCKAYLSSIKGGGKAWNGQEQLTFEPSEANDTLSKAIYSGVKYRLDVLLLTSHGDIAVCNYKRHWARFPRLSELFADPGWYDLTIDIAGEDAAGETFLIKFEWTGNWKTAFLHSADNQAASVAPPT